MNFTKIDLSKPETLPPEEKHVLLVRGWPFTDCEGFMKRNQWGKPEFFVEERSGDPTKILTPKGWIDIDDEDKE